MSIEKKLESDNMISIFINGVFDGVILEILLAIFILWTLYDFARIISAFHNGKPYFKKIATTCILLFITLVLSYLIFYSSKKIPIITDVKNLNEKLVCKNGEHDCKIDDGYLECSGFGENNNNLYECEYDKRIRTMFTRPNDESAPLRIDNLFYDIDEFKLSLDKNTLKATFGLVSSITDEMVSLQDQKELNITLCGKVCRAVLNKNSTYSVTEKWSELEVLAQKNCEDSVCIDQNNRGCYSRKNFNIFIPYKQKHITIKDNAHIFYGHVKQNAIFIPIDKINFDMSADVEILEPSIGFVMEIGDNTIKIENNIISLNKEPVGIARLNSGEKIYFKIQKPEHSITVHISQEDGFGGIITLSDLKNFKNQINFGFISNIKHKKEVLSVNIGQIDDIRPR